MALVSNIVYEFNRDYWAIFYKPSSSDWCNFRVNNKKHFVQLGKALRAIGNCLACQVWHACRRLPTPAVSEANIGASKFWLVSAHESFAK